MARARQVMGGVLLAAMTFAVVAVAVCVLWLALPLLNPGHGGPQTRDIPVISTDSKISRPVPQPQVSPRSGVMMPAQDSARPHTRIARRDGAEDSAVFRTEDAD